MDWMITKIEGNPNHVDVKVTLTSLENGEIKTQYWDRANFEYCEGTVLDLTDEAEEFDIWLSEEDYKELWEQERALYQNM